MTKLELPHKRSALERLLELGLVQIGLDARHEDVQVPPHLVNDLQLRLNLSYRFGLPLDLGEWGLNTILTFSGTNYECLIPWECIYLMISHVSGESLLYPSDVPPELLTNLAPNSDEEMLHVEEDGRPDLHLAYVDPAGETPEDPTPPSKPGNKTKKSATKPKVKTRNHLRVVK
tara:strand:+ start:61 stop:582 length:522 start_codon:yes stop_codon:yes gene_type:complete